MDKNLYTYLLLLGDNPLILGHRLSELCGHGPSLETDIALTNISLDLFGLVRNYFQYAAQLEPEATEDSIAFLRLENAYRNVQLVEQPNEDFAHVICRQFLFDQYHILLLEKLASSTNQQLRAIAAKSIKEVRYHVRFSSEWIYRLGDGTQESHRRMQAALDVLWPYTRELFEVTEPESLLIEKGIAIDNQLLQNDYHKNVEAVLVEATLQLPSPGWWHTGGKKGHHTEHLGYILNELQFMQRTYPNMLW